MRKMKCLTSKKSIWVLLVFASLQLSTIQAQETQEKLTLTLGQAIEIALAENPTIIVAGQEIELKKEAKREAYGGLLPEASLVGNFQHAIKKQSVTMDFGEGPMTLEMGSKNTYNGGLNISLPVFAPALYKAISLTKTDIDLAVEKSRASEQDLINQVTKAFYQLLLAQDGYQVLLKSYDQSVANYNIVEARFKQGLVSEYDKIRADVQTRSIKPSVVAAKNGVELAKLNLKVLIALDADIDIVLEGNLREHEMEMFQTELSDRNTDVMANTNLRQLDINAELLRKNLKLQQTNFMPTLGLGFNYTYMTMAEDFKFNNYNWTPYSMLNVSLTIPLFKASNFTKIKQTRIQMSQLSNQRINLERQLKMQAESYRKNMAASTEQVISNRENIVQAEKGRTIAQKRYEVGNGTILELNDSEVALTQAELTYAQSIYDYLVAKADLDMVLGKETEYKSGN
ncbi:TolC family protein [Bacteroides sp. OttesenSCG-928-D19]|nr:TolC family protein [Bacteroides sp. OttesenSCG-928-D19]